MILDYDLYIWSKHSDESNSCSFTWVLQISYFKSLIFDKLNVLNDNISNNSGINLIV